jgi:hypothetical protein
VLRDIYKALRGLARVRILVDVVPSGSKVVVRTNGLAQDGLPELEIVECPLHLQDVAKNLVQQLASHARDTPESLADGKTIGSRFARPDQQLLEACRLARSEATPPTLRIVDLESNGRMFLRNLIATHLCATASTSAIEQLRLLLVAIEVWPKEGVASNAPLGDYELNPNNFWSWIDLGSVFEQRGELNDALVQWKTAVCVWPRGGKTFATRMLKQEAAASSSTPSQRVTQDFWRSVSNDTIRIWARELDVELPDAVLAD